MGVFYAKRIRGQNVPVFKKKGPFGLKGSFFKCHHTCSLKNINKFGSKITQNSRLGGVFPGEGKGCSRNLDSRNPHLICFSMHPYSHTARAIGKLSRINNQNAHL